jgi:hypothetical protein
VTIEELLDEEVDSDNSDSGSLIVVVTSKPLRVAKV